MSVSCSKLALNSQILQSVTNKLGQNRPIGLLQGLLQPQTVMNILSLSRFSSNTTCYIFCMSVCLAMMTCFAAYLTHVHKLLMLVVCRHDNEIIKQYFWGGFSYQCMIKLLSEYHEIHISIRTLRRRLQDMGLARRKQCPPMLTVWNTIHMELQGPG